MDGADAAEGMPANSQDLTLFVKSLLQQMVRTRCAVRWFAAALHERVQPLRSRGGLDPEWLFYSPSCSPRRHAPPFSTPLSPPANAVPADVGGHHYPH